MNSLKRIANADAHHRLLIALGVSMLVFLGLDGRVSLLAHVFVTWDCFSICVLILAWLRIISSNPQSVRRSAKLQDSSRTLIFVFVTVSACASLLALGAFLGSAKGMSRQVVVEHVTVSMLTVVCSWTLIHTIYALRYAHLYYIIEQKGNQVRGEGLEFPGGKEPDYMDFAYFSFVIGMTCQVSDVQITSKAFRRLALAHGLVSFVFNMFILALTINIISGLLS